VTTPPLRRSVAIQTADMPFAPAPIEELMRTLVKAVRAQQLYMPNNPMYRTAVDALRSSFVAVWKETDELALGVAETALTWLGAPVLIEAAKSSDNLAWLFYKDGIREIVFLKGVEETGIIRFLELVARARKATVDDDDLVTMLWEAELSLVQYRYVDMLMGAGGGADALPDAEPVSPSGQHTEAVRAATATLQLGTPATPVLSASGTGATLPAATYSVIVVALTLEGYQNSALATGTATTKTVTGADGKTFVLSGGSSNKSGNATQAVTFGQTSFASVAAMQGAVAYAW